MEEDKKHFNMRSKTQQSPKINYLHLKDADKIGSATTGGKNKANYYSNIEKSNTKLLEHPKYLELYLKKQMKKIIQDKNTYEEYHSILMEKNSSFNAENINKEYGETQTNTLIRVNSSPVTNGKLELFNTYTNKISDNFSEKNNNENIIELKNQKETIEEKELIQEDEDDIYYRKLRNCKNINESFSEEECQSDEIEAGFILQENSLIKRIWNYIIILCAIFSYTIEPIALSFRLENKILYFDALADVVFLIDLILNFFSPLHKNHKLIKNQMKIIKNYVGGWFIIDLFSSIPLSILYIAYHESLIFLISILIRCFRLINLAKKYSIKKIFDNIKLNSNPSINRIVKFCLILLIFVNFTTCIFIYLGIQNKRENSWLVVFNLQDLNGIQIYIASFYFNLVTLFSIGYGDITPKSNEERLFSILNMMIGCLLFSYAISDFSTLFSKIDESRKILKDKLIILDDIDLEYGVPKKLNSQIKKHILVNSITKLEKFDLLEKLPQSLRKELLLHMLNEHRTKLTEINFFKGHNKDFIIFVLPFLRSLKVFKHYTIISIGEYFEEMYIILRGNISLNLDKSHDNLEIAQLTKNKHFGDIYMCFNEKSPFSLVCKSLSCDLFSLKKEDMNKIKLSFNEIILSTLENSCQELEKIEKTKKIFMDLYTYGISIKEIKKKFKKINDFLLKRNFNSYFLTKGKLTGPEDFFSTYDIEDINKFLETDMTERDFQICFHNFKRNSFLAKKPSFKLSNDSLKRIINQNFENFLINKENSKIKNKTFNEFKESRSSKDLIEIKRTDNKNLSDPSSNSHRESYPNLKSNQFISLKNIFKKNENSFLKFNPNNHKSSTNLNKLIKIFKISSKNVKNYTNIIPANISKKKDISIVEHDSQYFIDQSGNVYTKKKSSKREIVKNTFNFFTFFNYDNINNIKNKSNRMLFDTIPSIKVYKNEWDIDEPQLCLRFSSRKLKICKSVSFEYADEKFNRFPKQMENNNFKNNSLVNLVDCKEYKYNNDEVTENEYQILNKKNLSDKKLKKTHHTKIGGLKNRLTSYNNMLVEKINNSNKTLTFKQQIQQIKKNASEKSILGGRMALKPSKIKKTILNEINLFSKINLMEEGKKNEYHFQRKLSHENTVQVNKIYKNSLEKLDRIYLNLKSGFHH